MCVRERERAVTERSQRQKENKIQRISVLLLLQGGKEGEIIKNRNTTEKE